MENEVWKPVVGYENYYEVSNKGNVRSVNRIVTCNKGTTLIKGVLLKQYIKGDYRYVYLQKEGHRFFTGVARLVASAFLPNPEKLPEVNHKDEDKSNNSVENLEWCSRIYNIRYGTAIKRKINKATNGIRSVKVLQFSKDGIFIKEWPSMGEIKRSKGYNQGAISSCCSGKCKSCYGYVWRYS